jgi:polyphosphate kinase
LLEEAAPHGIRLLAVKDLTPSEWGEIDEYFESQIFPVLTPLAVDPGHPFPYISNLSLSLAVEIRDPEGGVVRFARVKVPKSLSRWVPGEWSAAPFHSARAGDRRQSRRAVSRHGDRRVVRVSNHAVL